MVAHVQGCNHSCGMAEVDEDVAAFVTLTGVMAEVDHGPAAGQTPPERCLNVLHGARVRKTAHHNRVCIAPAGACRSVEMCCCRNRKNGKIKLLQCKDLIAE